MFNIFLILIAFAVQQTATLFRSAAQLDSRAPFFAVRCVVFSCAVVALFWALGAVVSLLIRRRLAARPERRQRLFQFSRRFSFLYKIALLASYFIILVVLDWHSFSESVAGIFFVHILVKLAPFFVLLALSWQVSYGLEKSFAFRKWSLRQYADFQFRHISVIVLALLVFSLFSEIIELSADVEMFLTLYPELMLISFIPLVGLVYSLIPLFARFMWKVESFPKGALRDRLVDICRRNRVRVRDILLWHTGEGSLVNAAVLGILPGMRYVILTDGLVENLSREEIEAVFGHELGHARHRHIAYYAAFLMTISFLTMYIMEPFQIGSEIVNILLQFAITFGLFIGVVFGLVSRRFEREADLFGCKVVGSTRVFVDALEKVAHHSGGVRTMPSWSHSSIERRVDFLLRVEMREKDRRVFQKRIGLIRTGIVVLGLACLLFSCYRLYSVPRSRRIAAQVNLYATLLKNATDENERLEIIRYIAFVAAREGDMKKASSYYMRYFKDPDKAVKLMLDEDGANRGELADWLKREGRRFLDDGRPNVARAMFAALRVAEDDAEGLERFARSLYSAAVMLERRGEAEKALLYLGIARTIAPGLADIPLEAGRIRYLRVMDSARARNAADLKKRGGGIRREDILPQETIDLRMAALDFQYAVNYGAAARARLLQARCYFYCGANALAIVAYASYPGNLDNVERNDLLEMKMQWAATALRADDFRKIFLEYMSIGKIERHEPYVFRHLLFAEVLRRKGDYEAAKNEYELASAVLLDNPVVMLRYADFLAERDRRGEAVYLAKSAVSLSSGAWSAYAEAAGILERCGEKSLAQKYIEIARRLRESKK